MFGYELRWFEKILFIVNLVGIIGILVGIWFGFGQNSVQNCWDNYLTEQQAITHCEK